MANQSNLSVPPNIEDPLVLRRFLSVLSEQVDIIQGKRTGEVNRYVEVRELLESAEALTQQVEEARKLLADASRQLQDLLDDVAEDLNERLDAVEAKNNEQDSALNNYVAIKACQLNFTVDGSNNIVYNVEFNINTSSSSRVGVGLYEFVLTQTTFDGDDLLSNLTVSMQEEIADSLNSAAYHLSFDNSGLPAGTFRIQVQIIEQGTGNRLEYNAYDLQPGDSVSLTALFNIPGSVLPS